MGCACGGNGGTALGNYIITRPDGSTIKKTAVTQSEASLVASRVPGSTFRKTS